MIADTPDTVCFGPDTPVNRVDQSLTLFVGCLDPQTSKDDLCGHFKQFDPWVKAKLIVNFKTGQSKQCGLLFCSSPSSLKVIMAEDHYIHQRRIRVNPAQSEYKGTKNHDYVKVHISGLEPDISLSTITETFSVIRGFCKARLVQGLHPKQKKVAVLYFEGPADAGAVLQHSHIKVGFRNCKVTPYHKEKHSFQPSDGILGLKEKDAHEQWPSFSHEGNGSQDTCTSPFNNHSPKTNSSECSTSGQRRLSSLTLKLGTIQDISGQSSHENESTQKSDQAYVHPVEIEKDSLYRIFCLPPPPQFDEKQDPILKASSDSRETRDE